MKGVLIGRLKELGSAHSGASHWVGQRLSGAALALLATWFLISLASLEGMGYDQVIAWLQQLPVAAATALMIILLSYHSYLGVQIVIEDYVSAIGTRTIALSIIQLLHWLGASMGLFALIRIFF